jgi:hypothetical protein
VGPEGNSLVYSTFLGSGEGYAVAVDSSGRAHVAGMAYSSYPVAAGAAQGAFGGDVDGFVSRLSADGSGLEYSTFLGGLKHDRVYGIALDQSGAAYVVGTTYSADFPVSSAAFERTMGGYSDAFVAKLASNGGSLVYSTFVGGASRDEGFAIAVTPFGEAVIAGMTGSANFPVTASAYRTAPPGYGHEGFVASLNSTGAALRYSTLIGPVADYSGVKLGLALDESDNAYVTGATSLAAFPTTSDAFQKNLGGGLDAFLVKILATGTSAVFSTFLGGTDHDYGRAVVTDGAGTIFLTGYTS